MAITEILTAVTAILWVWIVITLEVRGYLEPLLPTAE